ncbi:hypothetical protein GCM10022215_04190 [Nocardioides fonticola]|uniref:D-inositol 3-phosphate glycosyltransferase n=1 Tax=Nocardioides fonticola TaxID=450363 RepID=A0ABP7XAQ6_9ACTN
MTPTDRVVIWRQTWLPGSETFIRNQVDSLSHWRALPIAVEHLDSPISGGGSIVLGDGLPDRIRRRSYRVTRRSSAVRRAIRDAAPAIIHAHFANDAGLIEPIARQLRVPMVVTVHGYDLTVTRDRPRRDARDVAAGLRRAQSVITLSRFMADRAVRQGADPGKILTIPTGIPIPPDPGPRRADDDTVKVLFVGRLVEKKGVEDAIRAVAAVAAKGHRLALTIAGSGPMEAELKALPPQVRASVRFVGAISPSSVRELMATHDLFLAPSKTAPNGDSEGFGMVFLEAAAHRLPAVGYVHGGVPEAVVDGETGLLAPEGDLEQLSARLEQLVESEAMRLEMGLAGRRRVETDFDVRKCTAQLERHYDSVVGRG